MSVAQLEAELSSFDGAELDALEAALRREKLRRSGRVLSAQETRCFEIINQALPHIERFAFLSHKWEDEGLSETERVELLDILSEREAQNAARAQAVQQLSELHGESFENLWKRLMGEAPVPLVPRN